MMAPLLDVADFYDPSLRTRFETPVRISVETEVEMLQGRIDALVVQERLWVRVVEAKHTTLYGLSRKFSLFNEGD